MKTEKKEHRKGRYIAAFVAINLLAVLLLGWQESFAVEQRLGAHTKEARDKTEEVMEDYTHSFRLFSQMLTKEISEHPRPEEIWDYLKSIDSQMLEIEGDTFDGLYMYYQGRYLYSWDTPYSEYESTGYVATERPWYQDAMSGGGEIVFTPPYMSYANHYILSTISQLQPDGETVFAYDIKMGDIQELVSSLKTYDQEQMLVFDANGTVVGSTDSDYLGGNLYASQGEIQASLDQLRQELESVPSGTQREKLEEQAASTAAFSAFRQGSDQGLERLRSQPSKASVVRIGNQACCGYLLHGDEYSFLVLVPLWSMLGATAQLWLIPLLLLELLLFYFFGRIEKGRRNRELQEAYVELGQTQKRLELALSAAQKAAAIDDLTGLMNFGSFQKSVSDLLNSMDDKQRGILILIDGDHFKAVNDTYGHMIGDEVIKLSAQMIIGRIRTIDLASRLHGDEFAIFVSQTEDYAVAQRIMSDINSTLAAEAQRRNMPSITMSAGAVVAKRGSSYEALAKIADEALYQAKQTHNGGFAGAEKE